MNIHNVSMNVSAVNKNQYPKTNIPEIALAGRSNVGKSSLINKLLNRKNFARVSQNPGKTASINFYNIDDKIHIVDLPGYGYAKVSMQEKKRWAAMIDEYLSVREQLVAIALLVDIRHKPTVDDITMLDWIRANGLKPIIVATKYDKLKPSQIEGNIELIKKTLDLKDDDAFIPFSSVTNVGREELLGIIKECCENAEGAERDEGHSAKREL